MTGGLRQAEAVARAARAMGGMEMTGAARQAEAVSKAVRALGKDGMAELREQAERFVAEAKALHERYVTFLGDGPPDNPLRPGSTRGRSFRHGDVIRGGPTCRGTPGFPAQLRM